MALFNLWDRRTKTHFFSLFSYKQLIATQSPVLDSTYSSHLTRTPLSIANNDNFSCGRQRPVAAIDQV